MMEKLFDYIFSIFGPLSILSMFVIGFYLYRKKLYTAWQLRMTFFWPELIIKYRDHTRQNEGHIGIWYYVAIVSILLSVISILVLFSFQTLIPLIKKIRGT
jgi:hypothetical protein